MVFTFVAHVWHTISWVYKKKRGPDPRTQTYLLMHFMGFWAIQWYSQQPWGNSLRNQVPILRILESGPIPCKMSSQVPFQNGTGGGRASQSAICFITWRVQRAALFLKLVKPLAFIFCLLELCARSGEVDGFSRGRCDHTGGHTHLCVHRECCQSTFTRVLVFHPVECFVTVDGDYHQSRCSPPKFDCCLIRWRPAGLTLRQLCVARYFL